MKYDRSLTNFLRAFLIIAQIFLDPVKIERNLISDAFGCLGSAQFLDFQLCSDSST